MYAIFIIHATFIMFIFLYMRPTILIFCKIVIVNTQMLANVVIHGKIKQKQFVEKWTIYYLNKVVLQLSSSIVFLEATEQNVTYLVCKVVNLQLYQINETNSNQAMCCSNHIYMFSAVIHGMTIKICEDLFFHPLISHIIVKPNKMLNAFAI